mmetsp:Transcript_23596/g.49931  ORF Transcript_23596/g.49931 Transcript_23596/m.49931 type:complete len:222 (+) Transcript_23596:184-849(+)
MKLGGAIRRGGMAKRDALPEPHMPPRNRTSDHNALLRPGIRRGHAMTRDIVAELIIPRVGIIRLRQGMKSLIIAIPRPVRVDTSHVLLIITTTDKNLPVGEQGRIVKNIVHPTTGIVILILIIAVSITAIIAITTVVVEGHGPRIHEETEEKTPVKNGKNDIPSFKILRITTIVVEGGNVLFRHPIHVGHDRRDHFDLWTVLRGVPPSFPEVPDGAGNRFS